MSRRHGPIANALLIAVVLLGGDLAIRSVRAQPEVGPPKVLVAQEFRLVDKEGKTRASLGVQADGSSGLTLLDKDGHRRAGFGLSEGGGSHLVLYDGEGKVRAQVVVQADGSGGLALH